MLALQGFSAADLAAELAVPLPEARRVVAHVRRGGGVGEPIAQVRRETLRRLREACHVPTLRVVREEASRVDPFRKLLLELVDGEHIETVRIPLERAGRFSACVSSQVGCALACRFCATGRLGLRRNLEAWEIVEQVRLLDATLAPGERIHGVVFQGMGEPMANLDRVLAAIRAMNDPSGLAIDTRAMTVCTAGLPTGIRRLAAEAPKVRLGVSIGTALRERRARLMPIDGAHTLESVMDAAQHHARTTGLSPMFAYTLLAGVNDSDADAEALAHLIRSFAEATGRRPRLSIIPYNSLGDGDPFARAPLERESGFREALRQSGVHSHKRYSGGGDVAAACGQLAARAPAESRAGVSPQERRGRPPATAG